MEWQIVSRKGGGKGWNQGVQDQLLQLMTAMQNSISQLAQSMNPRLPPGSKGQGKGKPPNGQGKGAPSSPGERKNPNLKPVEDRAEKTTEEVKCPKCPNTYNWTTRLVCRSCGCKLPQGTSPKHPSALERLLLAMAEISFLRAGTFAFHGHCGSESARLQQLQPWSLRASRNSVDVSDFPLRGEGKGESDTRGAVFFV